MASKIKIGNNTYRNKNEAREAGESNFAIRNAKTSGGSKFGGSSGVAGNSALMEQIKARFAAEGAGADTQAAQIQAQRDRAQGFLGSQGAPAMSAERKAQIARQDAANKETMAQYSARTGWQKPETAAATQANPTSPTQTPSASLLMAPSMALQAQSPPIIPEEPWTPFGIRQ